jgi:tape measure domain-containing protein
VAKIGNVEVGVEVDASKVPAEVEKAITKPMEKAGKSLGDKLTGGLQGAAVAGGAAIGAGLAVAISKGFGRVVALDTAIGKMKGLGYAADEVTGIMAQVTKAVDNTTASLADGANAASLMMTSGIKPGKQLEKALGAIVSAAEATGAPMAEITDIFQNVATQGSLSADEINRFGVRGVNALDLVAKHLGITQDEAKKMVKAGKVDFDTFSDAMQSGLGSMGAAMAGTFSGLKANISSAVGRIGAVFVGPMVEAAKTVMAEVLPAMKELAGSLVPIGEAIATKLQPAAEWLAGWIAGIDWGKFTQGSDVIRDLAPLIGVLAGAFASLASGGLGSLAGAIPILSRFAPMLGSLSGPMGLLISVMGGLIATSPELRSALGGLLEALFGLFSALAKPIGDLVEKLLPVLVVLLGLVVDSLVDYVDLLTQGVTWVSNFVEKNGDLVQAVGVVAGVMYGATIAVKAWTAAQKLATAAMGIGNIVAKGFSATMAAFGGPWGLIIAAIVAVVAALVYFFTQTETGKKMWAAFTKFLVEAWENTTKFLREAFDAFIGFFTDAWAGLVGFVKPIIDGVVGFVEDLVANIHTAIDGFVAWWTPIWEVIAGVIKFVGDLIRNYFRFWFAVFRWLYEHAVKPVLDLIAVAFTVLWEAYVQPALKAIGDFFEWLWKSVIEKVVGFIVDAIQLFGVTLEWLNATVVQPVFKAIGEVVNWVWTTVIQPIFKAIGDAVTYLGAFFTWLYEVKIRPVFEGIKAAMGAAWGWIDQHVFGPMKTGIDLLAQGFEIARSAIEETWKGIKKAAATPINFILDTVWNKTLLPFWNGLVKELGLDDMALKKAPLVTGFARGGVLPGYTPGRDVHKFWSPTAGMLALSGGEGILVPQAVRALGGRKGIEAINKAYRRGGRPIGDGDGEGGDFFGDAWDKLQDAARIASEFVIDPAKAIKKYVIDRIIKPKAKKQNIFGQTVAGLAANVVANTAKFFAGVQAPTDAQNAGGSAGMGWPSMWAAVQKQIPYARMTSNYRAGAKTVNGGTSYHAKGRAIDLVPASMELFNAVAAMFPNASELIFTPAGARQLQNGKSHANWSAAVKRMHYNHVHLAMARGGVLPMFDQGGWWKGGAAMNASGHPEAVFTASQFAILERNVRQTDQLLNALGTYGGMNPSLRSTAATAMGALTPAPTNDIDINVIGDMHPERTARAVNDALAQKVAVMA